MSYEREYSPFAIGLPWHNQDTYANVLATGAATRGAVREIAEAVATSWRAASADLEAILSGMYQSSAA